MGAYVAAIFSTVVSAHIATHISSDMDTVITAF